MYQAKRKVIEKSETQSVEVLFNGACPVCNAGVEYQKKRTLEANLRWTDIHLNNDAVGNLELEQVRKYLHVRDERGNLYIGIDAFVQVWLQSRNHYFLAKFFNFPIVNMIASKLYVLFAEMLYRWNRVKKNW